MKSKKVGEIFSDYKTSSNIQYAEVIGLNIIKKSNTLEVKLYFDEYIEIKEIWFFERFLRERFQFEKVDIKIEYHEKVEKKSIKAEWRNLIAYMSHKYPLAKPMLLLKSDIEIENNNILIKMHIRGAEFLKAKQADKELEKVIENLFGIKYKIEIIEDISNEELKKIQEKLEQEEAQIVAHIEKENKELAKEKHEENIYAYHDADYQMPNDIDGYIPPEEENGSIPPEMEEASNEQEYIMGKPSRAKEKHIKIQEITANDGRVTLEGRILDTQVRECKSGKGMLIFVLYDGTGKMTIKSFAKDMAEGKTMIDKIENAKTIKVIGKAGLDTYAGDVTVIANTIIETDADIPEYVVEEEPDTSLILGTSMNITEPITKVEDLGVDSGLVSLKGEVIFTEDRTLKSGKTLFSFDLYDGTSTITCKAFLEKETAKKKMKRISGAKGIQIVGNAQMDNFSNELSVMANTIVETEGLQKITRQDNAEVKRVELHMHTKMSQMDGMTAATDLIKRAMK